MAIHTTYSMARANFSALCDRATEDREIVLINPRNVEDVALISAAELSSLLETAHLMRSPRNAQRLLAALRRALARTETPQSIEALKKEMGIHEEG